MEWFRQEGLSSFMIPKFNIFSKSAPT